MENDLEVPFAKILALYDKMLNCVAGEADPRVVISACLIHIAKYCTELGIKPTSFEEFWEAARSVVLDYIEVFQKESLLAKKSKK